jgi:hypothetical protein
MSAHFLLKSFVIFTVVAAPTLLNLVQGEEAIVESPSAAFEPLHVDYAETFIAHAGKYSIRPAGKHRCASIRAAVRTQT